MFYFKSFLRLKMKGAQFPWMVWMHVLLAHKGKHRSLLLMDKEKKTQTTLSGQRVKTSLWKKQGGILCASL